MIKWSIPLGKISGIGIFVHWTFFILLAWIAALPLLGEEGITDETLLQSIQSVALVLTIFGCVILHELGHALTARRFNIGTRDITLLPIGGLARLERMPEEPMQEFLIAIAGPAVNVVIAAILFPIVLFSGINLGESQDFELLGGNFLLSIMLVNIMLVLFNLLPAFPMDGGRVLRALLAIKLGHLRATQIAAKTGQIMAIIFLVLGLSYGYFGLIFIAVFVYLGAQQETATAKFRASMRGAPVRAAMVTRFLTLEEHDPLQKAVEVLVTGEQHDFPVVSGGKIVGILPRKELIAALTEGRQNVPVGEIMRRDFTVVEEHEMLQKVFELMRSGQCSTMPVVREGNLIGLLTLENVGEWMMIQSAIGQAKHRSEVENIFQPRR